jgi:hypothetical protein
MKGSLLKIDEITSKEDKGCISKNERNGRTLLQMIRNERVLL